MERGSRDSSPSSSAGDVARAVPPPDADADDAEALPQGEVQIAAAPTGGEPSGSDEMEPQPGPSGAAASREPDLMNNPGPSNSEVAQDNVSSAAASAAAAPEAGLCVRFPDEGSNSDDFWAASSSGGPNSGASRSGSGENLFEESSQDSNDDDLVSGAGPGLASSAPSSAGPSGTGRVNGVPLSSFSPQPSSSSSNGIAAGSALATAGAALATAAATSSLSLLGGSVSSSPSVARSAPGIITSSGRGPGVNAGGARGQPHQNPQPLQRPPSPIPGPSGYAPPGEISNPPSPLGGGSGGGGGVGSGLRGGDRQGPPRAGMKRHYRAADSAVAGPSGVGQSWKRANSRDDQAVPGPSGLQQQQHGTSEAAAAPRPRSPLSVHHSPIRQPLTPADHFMISSSTGLIDSVPPTPDAMDILGGDNDLSVPSPAEPRRQNPAVAGGSNGGGGGGIGLPVSSLASAGLPSVSVAAAAAGAPRRIDLGIDDDEMVDSTVDSTSGIPMQRESSSIDAGVSEGFCQSSRYVDNCDDDDSDGDQVVSQRRVERSDEGISTSGQVDEGQFRLVPNDPEDDMFNSRNPPRRQPDATFRELDPVPGPSSQRSKRSEAIPKPGGSRRRQERSDGRHPGAPQRQVDPQQVSIADAEVRNPQPPPEQEERRSSHADNEASSQLSSRDPISPLAPPLSLGQLGDVGSRDAVVASAAGSEQEQRFPEVAGFSLEVFQERCGESLDQPNEVSLQNPVPGPSRVQSVPTEQKRGGSGSDRDDESGHVSGHNLEGFLPCHDDLLPDAYPEPSSDDGSAATLVDAPLSSSFQGMDAESSFGHPVDLEDIQLQRLLPEQYPPSAAAAATSSSSKTGDPAARAGDPATSTSAPSSSASSSKFLLSLPDLPSLPTLKGEDILPVQQQNAATAPSTSSSPSSSGLILHPNGGFGASSEISSGDERRGLNLGMAFTGIPTSMSSEPRASTSSSSSGLNTNNNQQQHSSILESMTGPLSKRLRTLHTMQQQCKDEPPKSNGNGLGAENRSAEAVAVVPQPSSSSSRNNGEDTPQHEHQQQEQEQPTSNNNNNTKDGEHSNSGNSNDSNSSSDSSQPGSSGGPFLGGTTQTYSVTIETPPVAAAVMKPKKIFHQKSLSDADLFDVFGKDALEAGVATTIVPSLNPTSIAMSRPRRQRKDRTVWCDECKMHYFECECPIHQAPLQIVDNPVQSRARASVPSSHLLLRQLRNGENGIFTKQKIPKGSRFGPMEGTLMRHTSSPSSTSSNHRRLALLVRGPNKITYELDVTSEETSNWMRYVRPAATAQEQNILLDQDGEQLFFTTSKAIGPKQELRVGYSPAYASEWGLPAVHDEHGVGRECMEQRNGVRSSRRSGSVPPKKALGEVGEEQQHTCPLCAKRFSREQSLVRHLDVHSGARAHACDECDARFSHPLSLCKHRKKAHYVDPEGRRTRCPGCGMWFDSQDTFRIHLYAHNKVAPTSDEEAAKSLTCPECGEHLMDWHALVEHVGLHGIKELPNEEQVDVTSSVKAKKPTSTSSKQHKCELCYKAFSTEDRLMKHMAVHGCDDSKPLACSDCGKRFLSNSALACHIKVHASLDERKAYDCPICGLVFDQIVHLKEHVHKHKVNGEYACPHCSKSFAEYSYVRKHIRAFHGERKFGCRYCAKSFTSADKLRIHEVIHFDVRNFPCENCGKEFKRKDKLREHCLRMHANDVGGDRSAQGPDLSKDKNKSIGIAKLRAKKEVLQTKSVKVMTSRNAKDGNKFIPKVSPTDYHHFTYKCHECLLGFKRRGMLVNHLAKRHPEIHPDSVPELNLPIVKANKDYYCRYCNKVYKSSSKRKAHILKNHPGLELPLPARIVAKNGSDPSEGGKGAGGESAAADVKLSNSDDAAVTSPVERPAPPPPDVSRATTNSTFSATVGNLTSLPHNCPFCHKQYASNAKLLQHQRKVHLQLMDKERQVPRVAAAGGTGGGGGGRKISGATAAGSQQHPLFIEQQDDDASGDASIRFALSDDNSAAANLLHIQGSMSPVTAAAEVVQLTPVPQEEALRLASHGATVIHVPAAAQQRPALPHQSNVILVNAVPRDDSNSPIFIAADGSSPGGLVTVDSSQIIPIAGPSGVQHKRRSQSQNGKPGADKELRGYNSRDDSK